MFTEGHHIPGLKEKSQSKHRSGTYTHFTTSREEEIKSHTERKHVRMKIDLPKDKLSYKGSQGGNNCLLRKPMVVSMSWPP